MRYKEGGREGGRGEGGRGKEVNMQKHTKILIKMYNHFLKAWSRACRYLKYAICVRPQKRLHFSHSTSKETDGLWITSEGLRIFLFSSLFVTWKVCFENEQQGCLGGSVSWASAQSVERQLRSWSHGWQVWAPRRPLCWQLGAWSLLRILCLPLFLGPFPAHALSLSLSKINNNIKKKCLKKMKNKYLRPSVWSCVCKSTGQKSSRPGTQKEATKKKAAQDLYADAQMRAHRRPPGVQQTLPTSQKSLCLRWSPLCNLYCNPSLSEKGS